MRNVSLWGLADAVGEQAKGGDPIARRANVPQIQAATQAGWAVFASAACRLLILMVGATGLEPEKDSSKG
jgi:hypothetical protein